MSYREALTNIKAEYPTIHVEQGFDGWIWIFANGDVIATYNDDTGELVKVA